MTSKIIYDCGSNHSCCLLAYISIKLSKEGYLRENSTKINKGKEELTQPLDKAAFDDASSGWASVLSQPLIKKRKIQDFVPETQ